MENEWAEEELIDFEKVGKKLFNKVLNSVPVTTVRKFSRKSWMHMTKGWKVESPSGLLISTSPIVEFQ